MFIDVHDVVELRSHSFGNELVIGGNVSLNETMKILMEASTTTGFEYCKDLANHIDLIANYPVRDVGLECNCYMHESANFNVHSEVPLLVI